MTKKPIDYNLFAAYSAVLIMLLSFIVAYSLSTHLVWPFGKVSAYYLDANAVTDVPSKRLSIPIEIFMVSSANESIRYTSQDLDEMVEGVNLIWRKNSNITFEVINVNNLVVSEEHLKVPTTNEAARSFGVEFLGDKFEDNMIDFVILKSLKEDKYGGGIAEPSSKMIISTEFANKNWARWNMAHELGHLLNLRDVIQADNLMQADEIPGNVEYKTKYLPTKLTKEQAQMTRSWAFTSFCLENSCLRDN